MRDLVTTARRLLETRKTVKGLERLAATDYGLHETDKARLIVFRAALQTLAWVLEIDLDQIDAPPPLLGLPEQATQVTLHHIEVGDPRSAGGARTLWLAEIPAHVDALDESYSMETWSCFLSDEQATQLYLALGDALLPDDAPPLSPTVTSICSLPRLQPTQRPPAHAAPPLHALAQPDTEEGYIGQGVRRQPPSSPPPAASAGARRGPHGPHGPQGPQGPQRGA